MSDTARKILALLLVIALAVMMIRLATGSKGGAAESAEANESSEWEQPEYRERVHKMDIALGTTATIGDTGVQVFGTMPEGTARFFYLAAWATTPDGDKVRLWDDSNRGADHSPWVYLPDQDLVLHLRGLDTWSWPSYGYDGTQSWKEPSAFVLEWIEADGMDYEQILIPVETTTTVEGADGQAYVWMKTDGPPLSYRMRGVFYFNSVGRTKLYSYGDHTATRSAKANECYLHLAGLEPPGPEGAPVTGIWMDVLRPIEENKSD